MRPNGELPSDHYADRRRKTPELRRKAHLTVHPPSANLIAGDGTKNGLSRSEQRTVSKTQKQPLDRKSPIQVRCEPDFLAFHRDTPRRGLGFERSPAIRAIRKHGGKPDVRQGRTMRCAVNFTASSQTPEER